MMRTLHFEPPEDVVSKEEVVSDEVLRMISANVPSEFVCPQLRTVIWVSSHHQTFNNVFVSSRLTAFDFGSDNIEAVASLASVMAELHTPHLRTLDISFPPPEDPLSTKVTTALSSFVLRCGSSLTRIVILAPLTDAAIQHIMQLPELIVWGTRSGLPDAPGLTPLGTFPKLERLSLRSTEALNWLTFLNAGTRRISSNRATHTLRNRGPCQMLTAINLKCEAPHQVDAAFVSPVMPFRSLNILHLKRACPKDGCGFRLTDDEVGEMATALPNLEILDLGGACSTDSCRTTIACLLIISTCCEHLRKLKIHFRTRDLLRDIESMPDNPRLRGLSQLPRCEIKRLNMADAPLSLQRDHCKRVAEELISIFPSIRLVQGVSEGWSYVDSELDILRDSPPA